MKVYSISVVGASGVNGDNHFVSSDKNVFAIADGASGAFDKVQASAISIKPMEELSYKDSKLSPLGYINHCFETANERLIEKSRKDKKLSFGTMTMCVVDNGVLTTGMVGDTPAFLISENKVKNLSTPKKRYARAVECGVLTEVEAEKAIEGLPGPMKSNFEVFLPMIIPSIAKSQVKVLENDILFICCDGITDWVSEDELVNLFRGDESLEKACNNILEKIEDKCPKEWLDDRTMIAVRF